MAEQKKDEAELLTPEQIEAKADAKKEADRVAAEKALEEGKEEDNFSIIGIKEPAEGSGLANAVALYDEPKEKPDEELDDKDEINKPAKGDLPDDVPLEKMESGDLIAEVKKNQRITSERNKTIEELNVKIGEIEGKTTTDAEVEQFTEGLKKDFFGTVNKYRDKFGLPSGQVIQKQLEQIGNITAQVESYQKNELTSAIEKKHKLVAGEFEYSADEASKAGTASYDWDDLTGKKRQLLESELSNIQKQDTDKLHTIEEQQEKDKKWYAETYHDSKVEEVTKIIEEMNIEKDPNKHPFSLRNLLRGYKHEELVKTAIEKAVEEVKKQYTELGMYLPGIEKPTDLNNLKPPVSKEGKIATKKELSMSPMLANISNALNGS